jgi:hypothetical protein
MNKKIALLSFIVLMLCSPSFTYAQDAFMPFTSSSEIMPNKAHTLKVSYERKNGGNLYFNGNYGRISYHKSISNYLSLGASISLLSESFVGNEISALDKETRQYNTTITDRKDYNWSVNAKFRLADAEVDPIGLALSTEFMSGSNYQIFTPKLIIDKAFGNNYVAFNAAATFCEMKKQVEIFNSPTNNALVENSFTNSLSPVFSAPNLMPNYTLNLAYLHFMNGSNFAYGCEIRTNSESIEGVGTAYMALFAGPTLSYKSDKMFANVAVLPQIKNLHKSWIAPDNLVLDAHQQIELKISFGFVF